MGAGVVLGGEQEPSEFTAIHRVLFTRFDLGSTHVLGWIGRDATVDVGEAVVAAHRRQPPIDRRRRKPALFHRRAVDLDVGSRRVEHRKVLVGGPLEVVAQVVATRLEGATVVAGQERGSGDLGLVGRPRPRRSRCRR